MRTHMSALILTTAMYLPGAALAGGLLGDLVQGVGKATGIAPLQRAGDLCVHPSNRFQVRCDQVCSALYVVRKFTQLDTGESRSWNTRLTEKHVRGKLELSARPQVMAHCKSTTSLDCGRRADGGKNIVVGAPQLCGIVLIEIASTKLTAIRKPLSARSEDLGTAVSSRSIRL